MKLEITKRLSDADLVVYATVTLLAGLLWTLPIFIFHEPIDRLVPFVFMGQVAFSLPLYISSSIAFVLWTCFWGYMPSFAERLKLLPSHSALPFAVGMLLVASSTSLQTLDSKFVAFLLVVHAMGKLFDLYYVDNQVLESFKVVLFILLASLFSAEYMWMLGLFLLGLAVFKVGSFRIVLSSLTALLLFVWLVWGVCYLTDGMDVFWHYAKSLIDFRLPDLQLDIIRVAACVSLVLTTIVAMISVSGIAYSFDTRVRLNRSLFNAGFFYVTVIIVLFSAVATSFIPLLVFISAFVLSLFFAVGRGRYPDIFFLVLLILAVAYRVVDEFIELGWNVQLY